MKKFKTVQDLYYEFDDWWQEEMKEDAKVHCKEYLDYVFLKACCKLAWIMSYEKNKNDTSQDN